MFFPKLNSTMTPSQKATQEALQEICLKCICDMKYSVNTHWGVEVLVRLPLCFQLLPDVLC